MAESFRSAQGTIVPKIFIGMGGSGSRVVDRIAALASRLPNWDAQLRPLTAFLSVDTNRLDQNKLQCIPAGNQLLIGAFDKPTIIDGYRRNNNQQALHWLDKAYQPRKGRTPGAGQIRVESRLGFFHQSPIIRKRLTEIVDSVLEAGITWRQTGDIYVYLFSTLAGGTGSGSFLSMAYLMDDVIRNAGDWQPRIISNLMLSTLLIDVVGKDLHSGIHANTYAALKELEHLTKLNYKQVRDEGRTRESFAYWFDESADQPPAVEKPPFFLSLIFDRPANFALGPYETTIGDASFLQLFTPNIDYMASALDNYEKNLADLTQFPGDLRNVGLGYTKNFGCMGACALTLPGGDLLEYCSLRFAAEAVRSQITFGVDARQGDDDRARALAKIAINYADPKFLSMGDEGRHRAINKAFLDSVREMARQDAVQELKEGFWFQLVESVDEGRIAGNDAKGEVLRNESTLALVRRKLEEDRRTVINKVSIKERSFSFHKEGVNTYQELVSRLKDEIRAARVLVEQGIQGLKRSAAEGEVVAGLKLDPITERYLVLRLLEETEQKWIPEAQKQFDAARTKDIGNSAVSDRLEENYKSLQQAASEEGLLGRILKRDQAFYNARDEAQEYYRSVGAAARKVFDSEACLGQLRELLAYLQERAQQYATLAQHMNRLVNDLGQRAEELRRGQGGDPRLALSVEVFETLDEPRERIWDRVYLDLFVARGRAISTFDRATLAACIAKELKPVIREDGAVVRKTIPQTVTDLREALLKLGRERLRPTIFGESGDPGLDLRRGLRLEARLILEPGKPKGEEVPDSEIDAHAVKKFKVLAQLSGVLARLSTAEWRAAGDGTKTDQTRYLVHGFGRDADSSGFVQNLKSVLQQDGKLVNLGHWHDPRIAIVYDVELPIPLYYIRPVIDEIERAYLSVQADEKRGYNLHTDYHWEEALPNLNPRSSELQVSWAVRKLAEGLVAGAIEQTDKRIWIWHSPFESEPDVLGKNLSAALYRIGEYYRTEELRKLLDTTIQERLQAMAPEDRQQKQARLSAGVEKALAEISFRQQRAEIEQEDVLDRPVLRVLLGVLKEEIRAATLPSKGYRLGT
jgi:hypothetical protein